MSTYTADAAAHPGALQGAEGRGQCRGVGSVVDGGQLVVQRLGSPAFDGVLVEEAGVQVADALLVGARCRTASAGFDDQVAYLLFGPVEEVAEGAVGRPVGGYVVFGQPAAVDVAEQVVLGAGVLVDVAQVDARADGLYCHPAILPSLFGCNDRPMSDGEQTEAPDDDDSVEGCRRASESTAAQPRAPGCLSPFGIASTVLGLLSVAAVVLGVIIWSAHRDEAGERSYLSRVMQTAADWTGVLINMNSGNIDASLQRLHDGTVGELNTDFDAAVQPYRQVVEKLQSQSSGRIEAVAIETVHHDLDTQPGVSAPGGHHQVAAVRHPHRLGDAGRHVGQRERRRQTADRALEPAARCLRRGRQADDLRAGVDPMRNLWRLLAFDIVAPLAAIAALLMIGVILGWPLWWVSACSVLLVLIVEGVASISGCCAAIRSASAPTTTRRGCGWPSSCCARPP